MRSILDPRTPRLDALPVTRLRHEVLGWLGRHGVAGVRVVVGNVLARRRIRPLLARTPVDALVARLDPRGVRRSARWPWPEAVTAVRLADALAGLTAGRHTPNCLDRAVGRTVLLRRLGWDAALVLGAPLNDLDGPCHAWAEVDGTPVLDRETTGYSPLLRVPPCPTTP